MSYQYRGASSGKLKNDAYRALLIENYRNLGLNSRTRLMINRTVKADQMGGLIFLIGPNNSGKSNVLDAVESISEGVSIRDFPKGYSRAYFPSVLLELVNGNQRCRVTSGPKLDPESIDWTDSYNRRFKDLMELIFHELHVKKLLSADKADLYSKMRGNETQCMEYLAHAVSRFWLEENGFPKEECEFYEEFLNCKYQVDGGPADFEKQYGFKLRPKIIRYRQVSESDEDCKGYPGKYSTFLGNMMDFLFGEDLREFERLLGINRNASEEEVFNRLYSQADSRLSEMGQYFNSLCGIDGLSYKFKLSVEDGAMEFETSLGDVKQNLDWSSVGFKWFFDFYLNFLCCRNLGVGDIVIMDEPALNLHMSSQVELTKRLRRYAEEKGVTFIISTHSPFMIDVDYLDEVRMVIRGSDGTSRIIDNFQEAAKVYSESHEILDSDPDLLKPVLDALTIERHAIIDPDSKVFFVEGVTDYLMFNAFKGKYQMDNVHFLPVGGLGKFNDKGYRDRLVSFMKAVEREPTLIVDGDPAGDHMEYAREKGVRIISLGRVLNGISLEGLFEGDDYDKFLVRKETNNYCVFRHFIDRHYESLSAGTKEHFGSLFEKFKKDIESSDDERENARRLFSGYVMKYCRGSKELTISVEDVAIFAGKVYASLKKSANDTDGSEGKVIRFEEDFLPVDEMLCKLDRHLDMLMKDGQST